MKYTIELTSKQKDTLECVLAIVHRYIGFNAKLEMDIPIPMKESPAYKKGFEDGNKIADKDLKEIQDSTYDVAYNKGLEDAWKLIVAIETDREVEEEVFGEDLDYNFDNVSVQDAMKKWKAYEEKKKAEIGVGDEVYLLDPNEKSVVTFVDKENRMLVILTIRGKYATLRVSDAHKTGRHFEEISQLLNKLRGEE